MDILWISCPSPTACELSLPITSPSLRLGALIARSRLRRVTRAPKGWGERARACPLSPTLVSEEVPKSGSSGLRRSH